MYEKFPLLRRYIRASFMLNHLVTQNMVEPSRWAIETVKPLEKYAFGRVAVLGDAVMIVSSFERWISSINNGIGPCNANASRKQSRSGN